jgi:hypothetical protein
MLSFHMGNRSAIGGCGCQNGEQVMLWKAVAGLVNSGAFGVEKIDGA